MKEGQRRSVQTAKDRRVDPLGRLPGGGGGGGGTAGSMGFLSDPRDEPGEGLGWISKDPPEDETGGSEEAPAPGGSAGSKGYLVPADDNL